jgi:hypothetical protein
MSFASEADPVDVDEPALLIRVAVKYRQGMSADEIYEITRGVWRLGERRDRAEIALAVFDGVVRAAYCIGSWHPAGSTTYATRPPEEVCVAGRWEFSGTPADLSISTKYVARSVAHYFKRGATNPVLYVNA